jgi:ribose transport system substrate-binding protein
MYKGLALILLVSVVVFATSCQGVQQWQLEAPQGSGAKKEGPIKLAVVPKALGFDFWEKVRLGAECAASKNDNVQMVWDGVSQETDVNGQYDLLRTFITQGVDGIVYAATDAKVLGQVTKTALDNGITVVNIDSGTDPQPSEVPVMATDNVSAAENVPKLLSDELGKQGKGGGKVAFIPFQPGTGTNDQRKEGFNEGLKDYPELNVVAEQSSQSDYVLGLQVTENVLTANPDLDALFAANEPGVLGAAEGLRRPGEAGRIVLVGWDGSPLEEQELREGVINALVVQNPFEMGYEGVNTAVRKIRENAEVESQNTSVTLITKDNVDEPEVQAVLHPSCDNPPV